MVNFRQVDQLHVAQFIVDHSSGRLYLGTYRSIAWGLLAVCDHCEICVATTGYQIAWFLVTDFVVFASISDNNGWRHDFIFNIVDSTPQEVNWAEEGF